MADEQVAAVPAPANNLTAIQSFYRILYNGDSTNKLNTKQKPVDFANIQDVFECAITMAQENIELPIAAIKKVYRKKTYWDVQYILAALAYCAKQKHVPELKKLAYQTASELIDNQTDFLMFVKFCRKISHLLNNLENVSTINNLNDNPQGYGGAGFGRGMRKMALRWYGKYDPEQLANMFGEHRSMCHLTHRRFIMKAHLRTDGDKPLFKKNRTRRNRNEGADASTSQNVANVTNNDPISSTSSVAVPAANVAVANLAAPTQTVVQVATHETDRNHVFEYLMMTGTQYLGFLAEIPELGPGAKRMKALQILKTNMNIEDAANSITENNFTVDQMPAHLLENTIIWEKLLPDMTLKQCFDYFHTIRDFTFLNPDKRFADHFIQQLELKKDQLKIGDMCPIKLFMLKRLYDNNARYLSKTKADWYEKKVNKKMLKVNPLIQTHLASYFHLALSGVPMKSSAKFFFTIDLRMGNSKKHVVRNKYINCTEASILLAYSTYERAKDVSIYTFSGKASGDLEEIHSLLKRDNFEHAKQICEQKMSERTFQSLSKPIAEATKMKKVVDIFVVIVDSVARFCRQGQVPEREFAAYKAKLNAHAKFLVVNLARATNDLKIPNNENMTGFFEVCGFTESTPKIMNALATQSFR